MTGPKHLWSGDWERESVATSDVEADRRQDHEDPTVGENAATTPAQAPETTATTQRRNGRIAVAATLAILVIAGIAIAATSGGSDTAQTRPPAVAAAPTSPAPTTPNLANPSPQGTSPANPTPTTPSPATPSPAAPSPAAPSPAAPAATSSTATTPTVAPQPVNWLGMEIITVPSGAAVVDTVTPGGAGDHAGMTPADTIIQIDGHAVTGSTSIARAVNGKHKGDAVTLTVVRGGTTIDVQSAFTGPPTAYP